MGTSNNAIGYLRTLNKSFQDLLIDQGRIPYWDRS